MVGVGAGLCVCVYVHACVYVCARGVFKMCVCFDKVGTSHSSTHLRFFLGSGGSNAANIASSNTFFRPFCEHKHTNTMREQHTHRSNKKKQKMVAGNILKGYSKGIKYLQQTQKYSVVVSVSCVSKLWDQVSKITCMS